MNLSILFLMLGLTVLIHYARRRFEFTRAYWVHKSSASVRVAAWTVCAMVAISALSFLASREAGGDLFFAVSAATFGVVVFGPINAWWGLRSLIAAWTFLDNNYGLSFRTIAGLSVGALSGLVLVALTGWELLSLRGLAVVGGSAALGWLWFVRDGIGDLTGN